VTRVGVTSIDVAALAGVSQSAVSRTFTAGASVGDATRRKVLAAARQLGYAPNAHARSLITGRSRIIGLVVSKLDNLFYTAVLQQLSQGLQTDGYHVLLFVSDQEDGDDLVRELLQYRVDGIILGATTLSSALARRCAEAHIPVVLFNRVMADATTVHSVRSDNHFGGRTLARLLVEQGHRRIAYLAGREDASTNLERERGFMEGLAEAGLPLFARGAGDYDMARARETADAISRTTGLPVRESPLLQERNFGELRGRRFDDLGYDPIEADGAPPGGETMAAFRDRVARACEWVRRQREAAGGDLLVVSHGLVIREWLVLHAHFPEGMTRPQRLSNTSVSILDAEPPHTVRLLDCSAHLEAGVRDDGKGVAGI
jgi:DNA-binding LacI/PurR family transcriptional regulator